MTMTVLAGLGRTLPRTAGQAMKGVFVTDSEQGRIVLVDDDEKLQFVLRAHLVSVGYGVECVGDGESAIERVASYQPHVVVMDVGLPGMDGIEATRRLKSLEATADIPVIMLTARSDSDHVVMALDAGAQEYVVKPFDVAELMARIRTVRRLRQTRIELDSLNDRLASEVESRTGRLRTLYNFTRSLNEADSRREILELIVEAVKEVTGSGRVSILLKDRDGKNLVCRCATGIDPKIVDTINVPTTDGIAGKVFTTGKTYVASAFESPNESVDRYGSDSFVSTPLIATSLMTREEKLGVLSITDKRGGDPFTSDEIECIRAIADSGAIAIHNQLHRERLDSSVNVLLMTVGRLAEYRDNETSKHLERVREYARLLATEVKSMSKYSNEVSDRFVEDIFNAAPMHDIGKVGIPDNILCKPDKLNDNEYTIMKQHCRIGREVLQSALAETGPVPLLRMCADIASSHHEKYDGTGYPDGLRGEEIPLESRIIGLVDAYDAITSRRRYKDPISHERAVEIIRSDSGTHFDPELLAPFLRCADRFDEIRRAHLDDLAETPARSEDGEEPAADAPVTATQ